MKTIVRRKFLLLSCIILVCIGVITGYAIYKSNHELNESEKWVRHTEQVIYQSGNILSLGKDAEAASRGFVITKDSSFLDQLNTAQKTTFTNIEQLRRLTRDNPSQQMRIDSLDFYIHKRLDFSYHTVELRSKQGLASAIAFVSTKQGKFYTDRLQEITNAIQREESALLKQRKQTNLISVKAFDKFLVAVFILMAVIIILMVITTANYLIQNNEKEKRAAELVIANRELVIQNEEKGMRAAELFIANKELAFQSDEKEKRAAELVIANIELIVQNDEKGMRAAELIIANKELAFQSDEKEKRAAELIIANRELVFQNEEKEKAGQERVLNERRLARSQQVAHMGSWELDFNTNAVLLSDEACRIFGLGDGQNQQAFETWLSFIHPDDLYFASKTVNESLSSLSNISLYYRIIRGDGSIRHVFSESKLEIDTDAKPKGYYGIIHDVTEIKLAEEKIEFDKNNLEALINNTNDLMWSVDQDFKLITSNKPFNEIVRNMSGSSIKKGSNVLSAGFSEVQLNRYKEFYERAFAGESFTEIEYTVLPVELWSEISYCPIRSAENVIGTACHSRDITKRRLAELERSEITNDLIQRNKNLEQFTYIISHNLRAPVANIIGIAYAIHFKKLEPKKEKEMMGHLITSVQKLDEVIKDLNYILQVNREVGEKKETVRFSELLENIQLSISSLIRQEDAQFITNFQDVDQMQALKSYLHSIFFNLILNSIKYKSFDRRPVIEITTRMRGNTIELIFKDNGLGIDLEKRKDQVFGLYKRFHSHTEGKGMGLFMVKAQVESMGGKIFIESEVNKGTEFRIEFEREWKTA
ncbi:MAG TPA: CHASE3 domain-containing protein [Puia sp.]|jgi:PAS domain S-box-containing protein|nr:CHASE3 domain-containing protein [Puia sp.]